MIKYSFVKNIFPDKLICDLILYEITIIDNRFIIRDYDIYTTKDNKIEKIVITKGLHPNCSKKSGSFCIPDFLKTFELNKDTIKIINEMFKIYNFESAYYLPWEAFEYIKK